MRLNFTVLLASLHQFGAPKKGGASNALVKVQGGDTLYFNLCSAMTPENWNVNYYQIDIDANSRKRVKVQTDDCPRISNVQIEVVSDNSDLMVEFNDLKVMHDTNVYVNVPNNEKSRITITSGRMLSFEDVYFEAGSTEVLLYCSPSRDCKPELTVVGNLGGLGRFTFSGETMIMSDSATIYFRSDVSRDFKKSSVVLNSKIVFKDFSKSSIISHDTVTVNNDKDLELSRKIYSAWL
jgi:hypothetical protein